MLQLAALLANVARTRRAIEAADSTQVPVSLGYPRSTPFLAPLPTHLLEDRALLQLAGELRPLGRIQLPEGEHKRLPVRSDELDSTGLLPQLPLYGSRLLRARALHLFLSVGLGVAALLSFRCLPPLHVQAVRPAVHPQALAKLVRIGGQVQ